jgi:hypothetical protein
MCSWSRSQLGIGGNTVIERPFSKEDSFIGDRMIIMYKVLRDVLRAVNTVGYVHLTRSYV